MTVIWQSFGLFVVATVPKWWTWLRECFTSSTADWECPVLGTYRCWHWHPCKMFPCLIWVVLHELQQQQCVSENFLSIQKQVQPCYWALDPRQILFSSWLIWMFIHIILEGNWCIVKVRHLQTTWSTWPLQLHHLPPLYLHQQNHMCWPSVCLTQILFNTFAIPPLTCWLDGNITQMGSLQ